MKTNTRIGIVILMLIVSIGLVNAEDAPAMYFEPTDGSCNCGDSGTIDLMINTSVDEIAMQADIYFDPVCVNITDVDYTGTPWDIILAGGWTHHGDFVRLGTGMSAPPGIPPCVYKAATLTVECICPNGSCILPLGIVDGMPGLETYNGTFACEDGVVDPGNGSVSYTVTVYAGQSTELTINMADFGNMKRGDTSEIIDSLTLTNDGDMDASVDAAFTTNVSATYGMVSGINTIPGNNFLLGEDGAEVVLTADGTNVYIGIVPANGAVDYDAILSIPNDAVAGAYIGDVEVTYI